MSIRRLPSELVNRIAAGEVVERPASAVKELVENALDAGARSVSVRLSAGGLDLIEVTDDGCGMSPGDMHLSLERHATSKLPDERIEAVSSFGFRGEALPSIASVARLTLESRVKGGDGWRLTVDHGEPASEGPASLRPDRRLQPDAPPPAVPARRSGRRPPRDARPGRRVPVRRLGTARGDGGSRPAPGGGGARAVQRETRAAGVAEVLDPELEL